MKIFTGDTRVVSLAEYQSKMKYPELQEVEAYWEGLKFGRTMPVRSEVDPRGLSRVLENAFVLERVAPGVARFRVAGQHLHELMDMDVRGMPLSAVLTQESRQDLATWLEQVFDAPAKLRLTVSGERGIGKPGIEGEMLILPLRDDRGEVSRALGCFVTDGKIGRKPRRFRIAAHRLSQLDVAPMRAKTEERRVSAPGMAEAPAPFDPAPGTEKGPGKRPTLRLVKSDE